MVPSCALICPFELLGLLGPYRKPRCCVPARSLQSARLLLAACNLLRASGGTGGGGSLQHLYAVIVAVAHDEAALAVDQNAPGIQELPIPTAWSANGSYMAAVAVAQHLHSTIEVVSYNDVACTVERHAEGFLELSLGCL